MEEVEQHIRVLMVKPGLDGHYRGMMVVINALRDAGMEVIYGGQQSPSGIVQAAIQEDADVIGMSILAASHVRLVPQVPQMLQDRGVRNVLVIVGGTIPREDIPLLKQAGIAEVFLPGAKTDTIVDFIRAKVKELRSSMSLNPDDR